jgi:iron complex outermembrane recepter protein
LKSTRFSLLNNVKIDMKKLLQTSVTGVKAALCLLFLLIGALNLSAQQVSGTIKATNGDPLVGASVVVKGTKNGTIADVNGNFKLSDVPKGSTLVASFVGYTTKEFAADGSTVSIVLAEGDALSEVVVTGVFDKRSALNSSVAITTLSAVQIDKMVPVSASDVLKNVPGVYVNSSLGEIRNTVNSRGVTTGKNDGANGYDYVSMQEVVRRRLRVQMRRVVSSIIFQKRAATPLKAKSEPVLDSKATAKIRITAPMSISEDPSVRT